MANRAAAGDQHPTPELAVSDSYVNPPNALERTITAFTPAEPDNSGSALQVAEKYQLLCGINLSKRAGRFRNPARDKLHFFSSRSYP